MAGTRAKPLNAKTRESLAVVLETIHDEYVYLQDAIKDAAPSLKERFVTKSEHLKRGGLWIESKFASTED